MHDKHENTHIIMEVSVLRKLLQFVYIIGLLLPNLALAIGLGVMTTHSHLNQNLNAQIPIIGLGDVPLDGLQAQLATPDLFEHVKMPYDGELSKLRFEILRAQNGTPYVHVYSRQTITKPDLNFLLQLTWPGGHMMRQYTVLLDPDTYTLTKLKKAPLKPMATHVPTMTTVTNQKHKKVTQYGPTKADDRLWAIASHARPDPSVSIPQTAIAIFLLNSSAFSHNSPAQLRQGIMLQLPSLGIIQRVPHAVAQHMLQQKTAVNVAKLQKDYNIQPATGTSTKDIQPTKTTKKKLNQPQTKPQTKPTKTSSSKTTIKPVTNASAPKATSTSNEQPLFASMRQALSVSEEKNQALEKQISTLKRQQAMLTLANQQQVKRIALLQQQLDAKQTTASKPDSHPQALPSTTKKNIKPKRLSAEKDNISSTSTTTQTTSQKTSELATAPIKPSVSTPKQDHTTVLITKSAWLIAAIILAFVLTYWAYTRWRNYREEAAIDEEFAHDSTHNSSHDTGASTLIFTQEESEKDTSPTTKTHSTHSTTDDDSQENDTNDDSDYQLQDTDSLVDLTHVAEPDEAETQNESTILTDPLEEAEVYLAYDQLEQAEQVLLAALTDQPSHIVWRIKLLEVYVKMQDNDKFNQTLDELPSESLEKHPQWQKTITELTEQLQSQAPELDSDSSDDDSHSIPFTPGLGLNLTSTPDTPETITAKEALDRAQLHLANGEHQEAKDLLLQVCEKGSDEEKAAAKKLLDDNN